MRSAIGQWHQLKVLSVHLSTERYKIVGNGELGMGNWEWGIGNWELGLKL
ncbi:MAG: hypothetical protein LH628_15095 [Microcoleus sp. CAN_BIN18]|nr:hypothetical protein [Microcoleus sp. CAN_BIN18]